MYFYQNGIFHIYNQGNNRKQIFYSDDNYEFFKWKMKAHLLPFGDFLAWCLMPNHFHWMFLVNETKIRRSVFKKHYQDLLDQRKRNRYGEQIILKKEVHQKDERDFITLNRSIGCLLSSYTQAVNKQNGWSGSLFRNSCKAKDCWKEMDYCSLNVSSTKNVGQKSYVHSCFEYIHENAKAAGLVLNQSDYPWSSAAEYGGLVDESIVNVDLGLSIIQKQGAEEKNLIY